MKSKDKRSLGVRIVAIVLVVLMVLSLGSILLQTAFAAETVPVTGSGDFEKWPIFIALGALFLVVVCAVLPSFKKKK